MKDRPPPEKTETSFDKFRNLAQRLIAVDKKELTKEQRKKRRKKEQ
jgi:hypothetical protein